MSNKTIITKEIPNGTDLRQVLEDLAAHLKLSFIITKNEPQAFWDPNTCTKQLTYPFIYKGLIKNDP